ncbi:hypothetical protein Tco_0207616 [Tanacetum coccineum]
MGCLPRSALFLVTESHSLTRSPNSFVLGESLEILDYLGCDGERLETDIREKDEKSSKNGQNHARNGKAWKRQSQIEAKDQKVKVKSKSQPRGVAVD